MDSIDKEGLLNFTSQCLKEASYRMCIDKLEKQIEFEDLIIDEMAKQLAGLTIWDNKKDEPLILKDKEEVKQYFENKIKE